MLTVCCVLVSGPVSQFNGEYVIRLKRMVKRYLDRPFRFVCLTDGTRGTFAGIETIRIPSAPEAVPANGRGYWRKLEVFNPAHGFTGRMLYFDLDTLIVAPLDPIVDYPAPLALTEDALVTERAHLNTDRYGRRLIRRYNSSVIVWDAGYSDLYGDWQPLVAERLSTDQDWIAEKHPEAAAMPLVWFPRISRVQPPWPADTKVVLVKKPKPHQAIERWPWFGPLWGEAA